MANKFYGYVNQSTNTGIDGIVVLETDANTVLGTSNSKAVTPAGLAATLGTRTLNGVEYGRGSGVSLGSTAAGSNGMVLLGSTGNPPAFALLTSTGGTVVYTTGSNSLNLEASGGGMVWSVITGASQAMTKSNGYFSNRAGTVAFTLPASAAVGDTFEVANMGANATGWSIAYNASQYIRFGNVTTTVTTGSLASSATGDAVRLVCSVASTEFVVTPGSIGNITYV